MKVAICNVNQNFAKCCYTADCFSHKLTFKKRKENFRRIVKIICVEGDTVQYHNNTKINKCLKLFVIF